ncbi:MAG: hypothetical protein KAG26_08460 [Methylococcales bacterium]|nr:hypothetical protein [Methylococcales bacterium]
MAYETSQFKILEASVKTDTAINGSTPSNIVIPDATRNNVFPKITEFDRQNGFERKRKVFFHLASPTNEIPSDAAVYLEGTTPSGTRCYLLEANFRDTQAGVNPAARRYAGGLLSTDALANTTSLVVDFEVGAGADLVIQIGDAISITNTSGSLEQNTSASVVTWVADQATITISEPLGADFLVADSISVGSMIVKNNLTTSQDNWLKNSTSGVYDEATYPLVLNHLGTIEQIIIVTMNSPTAFTANSDIAGIALGSGDASTDFSPINPNSGTPYFTLTAAGFSGVWAAGESFTVSVHPAMLPFWWVLKGPAGMSASSVDNSVLGFSAE